MQGGAKQLLFSMAYVSDVYTCVKTRGSLVVCYPTKRFLMFILACKTRGGPHRAFFILFLQIFGCPITKKGYN